MSRRGGGYPSGPKPAGGVPPVPVGMLQRSEIPTRFKQAVYFYGFDPAEIVDVKYLDGHGRIWVHLRNGELEWKGKLDAPPWKIPMPTIRCEDLVNGTEDCPACRGSGKVAKHVLVARTRANAAVFECPKCGNPADTSQEALMHCEG